MSRIHSIEAADLIFLIGRVRARQSLTDLAVEAFADAVWLYRAAGLSLMAAKAAWHIIATLSAAPSESGVGR